HRKRLRPEERALFARAVTGATENKTFVTCRASRKLTTGGQRGCRDLRVAAARLALSPTDIGLIADHSNNIHRQRAAAGAGGQAKIGLGALRAFHRLGATAK